MFKLWDIQCHAFLFLWDYRDIFKNDVMISPSLLSYNTFSYKLLKLTYFTQFCQTDIGTLLRSIACISIHVNRFRFDDTPQYINHEMIITWDIARSCSCFPTIDVKDFRIRFMMLGSIKDLFVIHLLQVTGIDNAHGKLLVFFSHSTIPIIQHSSIIIIAKNIVNPFFLISLKIW